MPLIFTEFVLQWKIMLFAVFLNKSNIWEKPCSWDKDQNGLSQFNCRIFKSTIFPEKTHETAPIFAFWYKFTKKLKVVFFSWVWSNYGCGQSGSCTLKLIIHQKGTDGINWFLALWYKFTQIKRWLKVLGVSMAKNGFG